MTTNQSPQALNDTVIANGYCVGCGACAVPEQSPFKIVMDDYGQYQSALKDANVFATTQNDYEKLCPFGSGAPNEDEIGKQQFSETCEYNDQVGYYNGVFAGHVTEGDFRNQGSSGGMGTWVLNELLSKGLVDYVVHVKSETAAEDLHNIPFKYQVSESLEETQQGGKSRYYPIELSEVLKTVRNKPGRYAVVGLPCFIKSIRLLQAQDPVLAERIQYCVGLVCGHLKSAHYAESLAWQMGIPPQDLEGIDFRAKDPSQPANRYSTYAKGPSGEKVVPTNQLFGADWGAGAFKYKACDFCDDVFAETADVVLGDAWLPEYVQDSYGTNVVVTRNQDIRQLIVNARIEGRLEMDDLSVEKAVQSQDAGLRHRKRGIVDRLNFEVEADRWVPSKRLATPDHAKPQLEKEKQMLRVQMRDLSHESFKQAKERSDINVYIKRMTPVYSKYKRLGIPLKSRLKSKLKSFILRTLKIAGYQRR
ncbi:MULTISPECIES: Coenzyme F420 hydrogenase/dehydrogenase, beta subunit C-terminal domain [Klebsiella]|nr:Coenzyme F420 hydrogenase/dehydrogenase, beta subunit C-terminal domain [Klebsiella pneumoniae]HAX4675405.1 coenzyme F420 hydrogenase [Escherichia coli]MCI7876175.1 Coenzyme F420 hydrogenase/dehydrogenase, beta subunit C-terminal domain [Klebsiella pneumoniae]MCI7886080.1 Coenzyme F420 hydrogenase/dehydrogenase, beta subunit C-terminal domain [Klebsiella pneumoniae]MCI7907698.1 Coenzyme F420 hydrogenase/dehydrogenase, beta subunit C-terminal domain [Klebsiella pneumoniae]HBS7936900.1 Coenzy